MASYDHFVCSFCRKRSPLGKTVFVSASGVPEAPHLFCGESCHTRFGSGTKPKVLELDEDDLPLGMTAPMLSELLRGVAHTSDIAVAGDYMLEFVRKYPVVTLDILEQCFRLSDLRLYLLAIVPGSKLHKECVDRKYVAVVPGPRGTVEDSERPNFFVATTNAFDSDDFKTDLAECGWESAKDNLARLVTTGFTVTPRSAEKQAGCLVCQGSSCKGRKSLRCSRCKTAVYCSKAHQAAHWGDHKKVCVAK